MQTAVLAIATMALLAFSGLAVAEEGPGDEGPTTSSSPAQSPRPEDCARIQNPDERRHCVEKACEHPTPENQAKCDEMRRQASASTGPRPSKPPAPSPTRPAEPCKGEGRQTPDCAAFCREHPAAERCPPKPGDRFVRFERDLAGLAIVNYSVSGVRLLDSASYEGDVDRVEVHRDGEVLEAVILPNQTEARSGHDDGEDDEDEREHDGLDRIRIHDNPTGLLGFKGSGEGTFVIDLADGARIERHGEGAKVFVGGRAAIVVAPGATWTGDRVSTDNFLSIHMAPPERRGPPPGRDEQREDHIQDAIERGKVGARVALGPRTGPAPVTVSALDDVQVEVQAQAGEKPTPDDPVRVVVSSDLKEGRTIVLDIDAALLDGGALQLRYFDVHEDGTETEVVFTEASSLADVLDPTDDGGQPEYLVVSVDGGLQAIVSVTHWSTHAITLASLEAHAPSVLIGASAGVAAVALAAGVMLWPRRRDE